MQSARAMASICCSPPESVPETWAEALAQAREEGEGAVAGGGAVAAGHQPDLEVLGDGELGEEPAALRHPGDALARHVVGGRGASRRVPSRRTSPAEARTRPMIAFSVVDLPAPLRPIRHSTSPARRRG